MAVPGVLIGGCPFLGGSGSPVHTFKRVVLHNDLKVVVGTVFDPVLHQVEAGVVDVVQVLGAQVDSRALGDLFEGGGDEWNADEGSGAMQVQVDTPLCTAVRFGIDLEVRGLVEELKNGEGDADEDAGEQVGRDDGDESCGVDEQRDSAVAGEVAHIFHLDEIETGEDEYAREAADGHH